MSFEDRSTLRQEDGRTVLVMSSRPGYLLPLDDGREACGPYVAAMRRERIGLAVVLLTPEEISLFYGFDLCRRYAEGRIEALHFPIEDGSVPDDLASFHHLVRTIRDRLVSQNVLVHCNAGLGRTGVVAAGLLVLGGAPADAAIARVRKARSGTLENRGQEAFIRGYERSLRTGP